MKNIYGIGCSILYIILVFATSKLLEKKEKEMSRKYIHIMLCNIWFIFMYFFDNFIVAAILPALFVVINSLSYKYDLIKIMEREDKKEGIGTVYYAISLTILSIVTFYFKKPILGLAGVLIMGYGDGLAAVIGQNIKSKEYKVFGGTKSIAGTITMFAISFIISGLIFLYLGTTGLIIKSIIIAAISTLVEAVSVKGLDNITVPLIVTAMFSYMI